MRGDGVGWLTSKRLRRLMGEEQYRTMVANQLYNVPISTEDEGEMIDDVVCILFPLGGIVGISRGGRE